MIALNESFIGMWMFMLKDMPGDFLACMFNPQNNEYQVTTRLRIYEDDKLFEESNDRKQWVEATAQFEKKEDAIDSFRDKVEQMYEVMGQGNVTEILMPEDGTVEDVVELIKQNPNFHIQERTLQ